MELICIGTGTAVPESDHACSGFLLENGPVRLLLDCGGGVVHNMARFDLRWKDITHVAITHFHNDHIGDLPLLFFAWKHGMWPGRKQPLTVIGPRGMRKLIDRMAGVFGTHVTEAGFDVAYEEMDDGDEARLSDGVRLCAARTPHTDRSLAFRVEAEGRSFCYTGDTGHSSDVATFAQSVDLLLMECSLPDDAGMATHLTPSQVADMARTALPKRLLLTHIYPQLRRSDIPRLIREAGWPGTVEIAADGARVPL
jgi:ribonuclease BN (tRNA processing enzyme)